LPDATIKKGNAYFDVSTWTGNAVTPRAVVSNLAFGPDLVWTKDRSVGYQHSLQDTVRGAGASKKLYSSLTEAENGVNAVYGHINSFDSNGFTVATGSSGAQHVNESGVTYVAWQWKESVSAGFDIVTYTGNGSTQNVAHSLGVTPALIIVKNRGATSDWATWHKSLTSGYYILLNTTAAQTNSSAALVFGNNSAAVAPTSSSFTVGNGYYVNSSSTNYVAYLFAEVAGYSKFGSYTGNGSTDGPFVYLGFRPKFVLIKATSTTGNWEMLDSSRDTYNPEGNLLRAQSSAAEVAASPVNDFLSNGFKPRSINGSQNDTGVTYIYAAFAENPFKNSLAR
jgi:hypothetical protein